MVLYYSTTQPLRFQACGVCILLGAYCIARRLDGPGDDRVQGCEPPFYSLNETLEHIARVASNSVWLRRHCEGPLHHSHVRKASDIWVEGYRMNN